MKINARAFLPHNHHVSNFEQVRGDMIEVHSQQVSDILTADMQIYKTVCTRMCTLNPAYN